MQHILILCTVTILAAYYLIFTDYCHDSIVLYLSVTINTTCPIIGYCNVPKLAEMMTE